MLHLEWLARDRLTKFRKQLKNVRASEFSSSSTNNAVAAIEKEITSLEESLNNLGGLTEKKFLRQHVVVINNKLFSLSNALGVLLRSTNLRNTFEAYFAFNQMASNIFGEENILIISSEWDSVPFYIPTPPDALANFVMIGMPAFASRNSLLLPLAAHELGHAVWRLKKFDDDVSPEAERLFADQKSRDPEKFRKEFNLSNDLFIETYEDQIKSECVKLICSQCEEMFCDFFGALIFKESYIYAFDAFISPGFGHREPKYPSLSQRSKYIKGVVFGEESKLREDILNREYFLHSDGRPINEAIVKLADMITLLMEPHIRGKAREYAKIASVELKNGLSAEDMVRNLRIGIPPDRPRSAVDILNAVWQVYIEKIDQLEGFEERSKLHSLMNNLCLKSLEIYEYRSKLG